MADCILPLEALFSEAVMSMADAAKKFGFSMSSGFEDFRDRLMEQLAVGSEKILGVGIAKSDLCIEIGCWRRGVIGIMEFHACLPPSAMQQVNMLTHPCSVASLQTNPSGVTIFCSPPCFCGLG